MPKTSRAVGATALQKARLSSLPTARHTDVKFHRKKTGHVFLAVSARLSCCLAAHCDAFLDCLAAGEIERGSLLLWKTRLEYSPILLPCQCTTANRERSGQASMW